MVRSCLIVLTILVSACLGPLQPVAAAPAPYRYEHGYLLSGPFRDFYEAHGDLAVFGPPLTDAFVEEGGLTVQYFAYARFEWHDQVLLTDLGRSAATNHPNEPAFAWIAPYDRQAYAEGRTYFPESGHTLGGAFAWAWKQMGGLPILGYPISEEFLETNADGEERLMQYFERAILSYHPEHAGTPDEVQRAPLGEWYANERLTPAQREPAPPIAVLSSANLPIQPHRPDGKNIALAAERLNGATIAPDGRLGFLATIGDVSAESGYVAGSGIVNGQLVDTLVGGGICTVSTLLYRAAWWAGIPVVDRTSHSFWLRAYADQPGLEAAVYQPGVELVIANDTAAPIYIEATTSGTTATVRLWGWPDGRAVATRAPEVRLANGAAAPSEGAEVINERTVRNDAGALLRRDRVITRYAPVPQPTPEAPAEPSTPPASSPTPAPAQDNRS
jgi:hypothetical protein